LARTPTSDKYSLSQFNIHHSSFIILFLSLPHVL
jgi:hypothetical protein